MSKSPWLNTRVIALLVVVAHSPSGVLAADEAEVMAELNKLRGIEPTN
jgi:hypothetical protein